MNRVFWAVLGLLVPISLVSGLNSPAQASGGTCETRVQLLHTGAKCTYSAKEVIGFVRSGDGHKYTVEALCSHYNQNGSCVALQHCRSNGERGTWYGVHREASASGGCA